MIIMLLLLVISMVMMDALSWVLLESDCFVF
jgi:hypothetical protein